MTEQISFGTDGWRAVIADQFTFANVERAVHAIGLYILESYPQAQKRPLPVLIGFDTRFLADKFAYRGAEVLASMGLSAKITQQDVPTPCIAYAAKYEPTAGALQFTASHNPPQYLGIKYIPDYAGPATNEITSIIVSHLKDAPVSLNPDSRYISYFDPKPPYLKALANLVDLKRIGSSKLKVGFDPLYGTSRDYLDLILRQSGLDVEVIHNCRDTMFGGGMPEPKPEYLQELIKLVKTNKLNVGLSCDGDADRFAAIDELGTYLSPNHLLCLLLRHLVKNRGAKGAIVRTVGTTHLIDRLAKKYGLEIIETPVGFKYIGEVMRSKDVLIGGEESGGVSIKGHIPEKDGIMGNLLLLEMLAYEGKPLSTIWQDLTNEAGSNLVYLRADFPRTVSCELLRQRLQELPPSSLAGRKITEVGLKDGIKLYIDADNWVLIRPSGTEPLVRLYVDSTDASLAKAILSDCQAQLKVILKELEASCSCPEKPMTVTV